MDNEAQLIGALHKKVSDLKMWLPLAVLAWLATSFAAAPALASPARSAMRADHGFEWSIESSTQGNFGPLSIGVGYVGGGDYLDENGVRRSGLHAGITITVEGKPALFQQPDVHEGEMLTVGPYRILIERLLPDTTPRATVILRVWL